MGAGAGAQDSAFKALECSSPKELQDFFNVVPDQTKRKVANVLQSSLQSANGTTSKGGSRAAGGAGTKASRVVPAGPRRLLDFYTVGDMLGQGAFGIVHVCQPVGQDIDLAVKMVDKVETPVDKIKQEADMLLRMDHHNVISAYDVFYEKCFVCIVMDLLRGGDLIVGMQLHWESKGKIPVSATIRITAQMASSIHYIHCNHIIHRDVKGDNYLCDRSDIDHPDVRVLLADFGTAVDCKPTDRLSEKVGTKLYWSPEFYQLDYSLKVDIWAMGVVVYGLLNGKFPFSDEKDVRSKVLKFSKATTDECKRFVSLALDKNENNRADSKAIMEDKWIARAVREKEENSTPKNRLTVSGSDMDFSGSARNSVAEEQPKAEPSIRAEGGANTGIQDRRAELVDRLQASGKKKQKRQRGSSRQPPAEEHYWKEWFSIVDRHAKNASQKYEWWSQSRVDEAGILNLEGHDINGSAPNASTSTEVVAAQLRDHNIDTELFGKDEAKTLTQMAAEVNSGAAVLMLDASEHKKLVRVVDVVILRIHPPGDQTKMLIETGEQYADGRSRQITRLPGTKKEPHMNSKQTAERIVNELINLEGQKVDFDFGVKEIFEEQEMSPSYPGVETVYRKEIIVGMLRGDPRSNYVGKRGGSKTWSRKDAKNNTKFFAWMTETDCDASGVRYRAPEEGEEVSGLVQAPIGLEEPQLRAFLQENKVDISKFGKGQAKTLKEISQELLKGESSLMLDKDGQLVRVVDVVIIKLVHSITGSILVQTELSYPDGRVVTLKRLPGAKRRPDENQFLTARRILKRQLKIEENHVTLDASGVQVAEEEKSSMAFPGLVTIYRKRIITATLAREVA